MKLRKSILISLLFFTSCYQPFEKYELLNYTYWNYFNSCMKWIPGPEFIPATSGFYYDSKIHNYVYENSFLDTSLTQLIDYKHYLKDYAIDYSIRTINGNTVEIKWDLISGIIFKQTILTENDRNPKYFIYDFEQTKVDTTGISQGFFGADLVRLKAVYKFGNDDQLEETRIYRYSDLTYSIDYFSKDSILIKTDTFPL